MALITCENVTVCFENLVAVRNVSFSVEPGDYLCIVGENGTGKSSLMRGMLGLIPLRSGTVRFSSVARGQIGYLPQQTAIQRDFPASVLEVTLSGFLNRKGLRPFYTKQEKAAARKNLARLEIEGLASRSYRDLSGGQQQRVLLARALCATEKILFLDEPVTGLDPVVTAELYGIIRRLNQEDGITVLMVSHDIRAAVKNASKILHLDTEMQFFGPTLDYQRTNLYRRMTGGGEGA